MEGAQPNWVRSDRAGGSYLQVRAAPGAKSTSIAGRYDQALRIRIHAPANDGKANQELLRFLARVFGVAQTKLEIVRGQKSRDKSIQVRGLPPEQVRERVLLEAPNLKS